MALPVNKKTLDTTIDNNIKANDPPNQSITAAVLHDTLIPIVNSTFGLKTIWAGWMQFYFDWDSTSSWKFNVTENYYDPNYFPALDPNTLTPADPATLGQVGNRYKVTNFGSGLTNGSTNTFEALNVGTSVKTLGTNGKTWRLPYGLTFDVKITAGVLTGLKVNNPGSGYLWTQLTPSSSAIAPQVLYLNTGGTIQPEITIDLSRVISSPKKNNANRGGFVAVRDGVSGNTFPVNLHILSAETLGASIGFGPNIQVVPSNGGSVTGAVGNVQYNSSFPYTVYNYSDGTNTQIAGTPGYWMGPATVAGPGSFPSSFDGFIEIKVPITYQP